MFDWFKDHPAVRTYARAIEVGAIVYFLKIYNSGLDAFEWKSFLWGLAGAIAYSVIGLLTPLEPFVGLFKTRVVVPADKAELSNTV